MNDKINFGKTAPNMPPDLEGLKEELDSMSVEELKEEFELLVADMDENSFDSDLLEVYLDAIERKSPDWPQPMDAKASYERFLERLKEQNQGQEQQQEDRKRRPFRGVLKGVVIAAAVIAVLVASMAVAQAAGVDLLDKIARWTTETFGFTASGTLEGTNAQLPPQLQGMKEALEQGSFDSVSLPTYWPEGYKPSRIKSSVEPEANTVTGAFCEGQNYIILSYIYFQSDKAGISYNIDEENSTSYTHNNIKFYIMTNEGSYLAVWYQGSVEGSISGVASHEELIKILESIEG